MKNNDMSLAALKRENCQEPQKVKLVVKFKQTGLMIMLQTIGDE
jgi:hypothetical protein